jgi:drug/metabolite transporter (DMT)-like permease
MVLVSVVWNAYVRATGRRVRWADVRQVAVPGICFGLNLAVFFAGATRNSVANAALLGSLAPFLIVPAGARLFRERVDPAAVGFALLAFAGVVLVLYSAPARGDATARGNLLGFLAMVLLAAYNVSTRWFRREIDVAVFMAAVCPIGAVAITPLALAEGGALDVTAHGWRYIVLLSLMTGVAAHGLNVFAQRAIPIGTIGVAQVAQPALAVLWSLLLLGESLRPGQVVGIAVVTLGLGAFLRRNERATWSAGVDPVEAGDEVVGR